MGDELTLLLQKEMTETLSQVDKERLDFLLQTLPEGDYLAATTRQLWQQTEIYGFPELPDMESDFARLLAHATAPTPARSDKPVEGRRVSLWWWRLAAAVLFTGVLLAGWYRRNIVAPHTFIALHNPSDTTRLCLLPDDSRIWLPPGSSLHYDSLLSTEPERKVRLEGTAFFEITPRPQFPFRIALGDETTVEVVGTSFLVKENKEKETVTVIVESGQVSLMAHQAHRGQMLYKGEKAVFDRKSGKIILSHHANPNEYAWKEGGLSFINTPLEEVCADIEQFYKVKIQLRNSEVRHCRYTAPRVLHQPLEKLLASLALVFHLEIRREKAGEIILEGGQCREN